MSGDFTPGAGLEPWQIERIVAFLQTKGTTNRETLDNLKRFFDRIGAGSGNRTRIDSVEGC